MTGKMKKVYEKRLVLLLFLFYGASLIVSTLIAAYYKYNELTFIDKGWGELIFEVLILNAIVMTAFIVIIIRLTKFLLFKNYHWCILLALHIIFAFSFSFFRTFMYTILLIFTRGDEFSTVFNFNEFCYGAIRRLDDNFTFYAAFVAIIYTYYYLKKDKENQIIKSKLEAQLANTKIKILKSQLQPHFLFNTLNNIYTLIDDDLKKSKMMLINLSDLLRELVSFKDENLIEIQEEISLLNKYINIVKTRFSDDLEISLNIESNLENALVPSMLIQPIVENSIKHGYSLNHTELSISIDIKKHDDKLNIIIKNDGKPLEDSFNKMKSQGLGIKNTYERLQNLYVGDFSYDIFNSSNLVITKIVIPYKISEFKLVN